MFTHPEAMILRKLVFNTLEDHVTIVCYDPEDMKIGAKRPSGSIFFLGIYRLGEEKDEKTTYVTSTEELGDFLRSALQQKPAEMLREKEDA